MRTRTCLVVAMVLATAVACSSSTTTSAPSDSGIASADGAQDAASGDSGQGDAGLDAPGDVGASPCDGATACNAIVNGATQVTTAQQAGAMPAFTGGTITPGTYYLTSADSYGNTGAAGQKARMTFQFTGTTLDLVQDAPDCVDAPTGSTTYTTSGPTISLTYTCPVTGTQTAQYNATAATFIYTTSSTPSGVVFTFTHL